MRPRLVLVGAGGFAREAAEAARAAGWELSGYLDDDPARHGQPVGGLPVLGGRDRIRDLDGALFAVCTGRPGDYASRARIVAALDLPSWRYATVIHPSASVASCSSVGPGSVLLAYVTLTADVAVGAHVAVMPHVTLTHDDVVGDFATIAAGACLGGGVRVGAGAYIGTGALIREGLTIGAGALVGMGAVVLRDIPEREVWAGNPARKLRDAP